LRYCGREFSNAELERIRFLAAKPKMTRQKLSKQVCQEFQWHKLDGGLKDMSCRVALLRMQKDSLVQLPPPLLRGNNNKRVIVKTEKTELQTLLLTSANELRKVRLEMVLTKNDAKLWNEYIDRYHYLGHKTLPGAQLRYFARSDEGLLALFGFGAAAWKTAPRDNFIGWTPSIRERRLHLIVNNARFLILPWIQSKHLASKLLGLVARRISNDWYDRYGYRPVLLETFVEKDRFQGTCYRAANWIYLGDTQGRGKLDSAKTYSLPIKSVWVFPLSQNYRQTLTE
jgi:Domain of unknown function (DUF4338)